MSFLFYINLKKTFGYFPNLTTPISFNEKIQWLKLNYMDKSKGIYADKYLVREFIKEKIGEEYLIPLILATNELDEIRISRLPDFPCILKANHSSGNVYVVKDKSSFDLLAAKKDLRFQLRQNFYHLNREIQYRDLNSKILVEKLLLDANGNIPEDVKIHCFNGEPKYIQVDSTRFNGHKRSMYDIEWNYLDFQYTKEQGPPVERPENLDQLLKVARTLSEDFIYARIDLYTVEGRIYFGEITFTPGSGFLTFTPHQVDIQWGEQLRLPFE